MISLKRLVLESQASEEAKKRGLIHKAGGNYAKVKGGPTVARSVKGKLVPVDAKAVPKKKSKKSSGPKRDSNIKNRKQMQSFLDAVPMIRFDAALSRAERRGVSGLNLRDMRDIADRVLSTELSKGEVTTYLLPYSEITSPDQINRDDAPKIFDTSDLRIVYGDGRVKEKDVATAEQYIDVIGGNSDVGDSDDNIEEKMYEIGMAHHHGWTRRNKILSKDSQDLRSFTEDMYNWTAHGNWNTGHDDERKWRNNRINQFTWNEGNPAELNMDEIKYMERGMTIPLHDIEKVLGDIEVGTEILLPPSGWSARRNLARSYGSRATLPDSVNVQFRMKSPRYGLPLNGLKDAMKQQVGPHLETMLELLDKAEERRMLQRSDPEQKKLYRSVKDLAEEQLDDLAENLNLDEGTFDRYLEAVENLIDHAKPKEFIPGSKENEEQHRFWEPIEFQAKQLKEFYDQYENWSPFDDECEIIRPGWALSKVEKVTKYVTWAGSNLTKQQIKDSTFQEGPDSAPRVIYVVELSEAGVESDPSLMAEAKKKKRIKVSPTTKKYMNTSVVPKRKGKKKRK